MSTRSPSLHWPQRIGFTDALAAVALTLGTIALFVIDVESPRGVMDGVGYPVVVALCIRFGRRTLYACAAVTSVLIVAAAFLLPDEGISIAGEVANRICALASVWIIALLLSHRLSLEQAITERQERVTRFQSAYRDLVREVLLSNAPFQSRIRRISEIAAEAMQVDYVGIYRTIDGEDTVRCLDLWSRSTGEHTIQPDYPVNRHPDFGSTLGDQFVIAAEDVRTAPQLACRLEIFEPLGIRAIVGAGIFSDGEPAGQITFGHVGGTRIWKPEELSAARALAILVTLVVTNYKFERALAAFELMNEGVLVEDETGRAVYANRAARELAGRSSGDPVTGSLWEVEFATPETALVGSSDFHELAVAGRELEIERSRLPDGGVITRINDVTTRNDAARERHRLQTKLQQAATMEAIGQLAGGVAHDFNNILGSIMGFAGFLAQDLPDRSPEHRFAERILSASQRGKELIDQILAFARARVVERRTISLEQVVRRSVEFVTGLLPPTVAISVDIEEGDHSVFGSAVQISQLIVNLCINARDAIGGKSGIVTIATNAASTEEIAALVARPSGAGEILTGEYDPARRYVRIRVGDTGAGIPDEALPRIFEPFFTTKGREHGSGLGLAVVHGVVESHGGLCHVKTAPNAGTVFSIYLPLVAGPASTAFAAPAIPGKDIRGRERVLVVDDESDIVDMLVIGLARLGYESVGVNDPGEALAAVEEDPQAWDIIVTDQVMPSMRGVVLMQRIKAIRPDIKTVLCTGHSDGIRDVDLRCADIYLRKPADPFAVARSIRALLDRPVATN